MFIFMSVFRLFFFVHFFDSVCDADGADVLHLRFGTVPFSESLQGGAYGVDAPGKKRQEQGQQDGGRCLSRQLSAGHPQPDVRRFQKFRRLFIVPRF